MAPEGVCCLGLRTPPFADRKGLFQVRRCSLRRFPEEARRAGGSTPAQPAETGGTAAFSSGKVKRWVSPCYLQDKV